METDQTRDKTEERPRITITGADEKTDMERLAKMPIEVGILLSLSPTADKNPRYPSIPWIVSNAPKLKHAALHVCGSAAQDALMSGRLGAIIPYFQRIQINGKLPDNVVEEACRMYPGHTIITQVSSYEEGNYDVPMQNHAIIVDSSGGTGKTPDEWLAPLAFKPCARIEDVESKDIGFAGGLGPDNIKEELVKIGYLGRGGWVDMETKVRTDDWLDLDLVEEVLAQYLEFVVETMARRRAEDEAMIRLLAQEGFHPGAAAR